MSIETSITTTTINNTQQKLNNSPCKLVNHLNVHSIKTIMTKNSTNDKPATQSNTDQIKIVEADNFYTVFIFYLIFFAIYTKGIGSNCSSHLQRKRGRTRAQLRLRRFDSNR